MYEAGRRVDEWVRLSFSPFGSADDAFCQKWQKCSIASKFTFRVSFSFSFSSFFLSFSVARSAAQAAALFNSPVVNLRLPQSQSSTAATHYVVVHSMLRRKMYGVAR